MPRQDESGDDAVELWERQPGESDPAWEAFQIYRDQQPGHRSQREVASTLGKNNSLTAGWSRKWSWVERAHAWDIHLDRAWADEQVALRRTIAQKHVRLSAAFQEKALRRLQQINPQDLSARDLIEYLRVTTQIERDAVGAGAPQRHELTGRDGNPIQVEPGFSSLPADERLARMQELKAALEEQLQQVPSEARAIETGEPDA